ncbi:TIM barrel protein [Roseibium sp.]|uniref:TIM barrel protein n=1 Tax=Roseibium sp. TaxID=1936156 RepID=UPI003A96D0ED
MSTIYSYSANTGFLWKDRPFLQRIRAAKAAGFQALEFHDEAQREALADVRAVLEETSLPVCGLNVRMGDTAGCAAIAGQADQAHRDFDEALVVAEAIGAGAIHLLAGQAEGEAARAQYLCVLDYACHQTDKTVLIEPICRSKMPLYFLHDVDQAAAIVHDAGHSNLKIMFDWFHVRDESGDVLEAFQRVKSMVGHVQIASWPERSEPSHGELRYTELLKAFAQEGYASPFGCEYTPAGETDAGLAWRL